MKERQYKLLEYIKELYKDGIIENATPVNIVTQVLEDVEVINNKITPSEKLDS